MDTAKKTPPNLAILKLTFLFFTSGMLAFLLAMGVGVRFVPELAVFQSLRSPKGWFLAHTLLLGWATMVAMGASFQITQIVLRTSLYSRRLGYIHFGFYGFGLLALLFGFFAGSGFIALGGISITLGAFLYAANLFLTFLRKKEWNLFVFGVSLSLLQFLITVLLGVKMGLGFAYGWDSEHHELTFRSHLWFGLAGWLSGLLLVYSFKLLPMFYVSKRKITKKAYWIVGSFHIGVWLQSAAVWSGLGWLAAAASVCMIASLGSFALFVMDIRKQRHGKQPIGVVRIAYLLIPVTFVLFLLWRVLDWIGAGPGGMNEAFILYLVLGWFSASILSYLSKILPFLWWAHRFRTKEEKTGAVLLSDMLPEGRMVRELAGYLLGVLLLIAGFLSGIPWLAGIGQAAAAAFLLLYLVDLMRVFRY